MKYLALRLTLVIALVSASSSFADDFSGLVEGVTSVGSHSMPGPMLAVENGWVAIASGERSASLMSTLVAARLSGTGRVVAMQWNGMNVDLGELDNRAYLSNVARWLSGSRTRTILLPRSHSEYFDQEILSLWRSLGFTVRDVSGVLTAGNLSNGAFLWIPGSWAVPSYSGAELSEIETFVKNGGGLFITGLGWSFPGTSEDFAPNVVGARFGIVLLKSGITDPTNNLGSAYGPVFSRIYPDAKLSSLAQSTEDILSVHREHPNDLDTAFSNDSSLRRRYFEALAILDQPRQIYRLDSPRRTTVDQFFFDLVSDKLGVPGARYLRKDLRYDQVTYDEIAFLRERYYRVWTSVLPLTKPRAAAMATAAAFPAPYARILQMGVYLADNSGLDDQQLRYLENYLDLVPQSLHELPYASFLDLIRDLSQPWPGIPPEIDRWAYYEGAGGAVNSFASKLGDSPANPFPSEAPGSTQDLFTGAWAHELNHVVDAHTVDGTPTHLARKKDLVARAGRDPMNYLRSMLPEGFFADSPQEFFASMANQWFSDSEQTFLVGAARFDAARPEPMNQALFFAEVYSQGGPVTFFYKTDLNGNVTRFSARLIRDANGHINELHGERATWLFSRDSAGNVVSYQKVIPRQRPARRPR